VREAIDRGVPLDDVKAGNRITAELRKLVIEPVSEVTPKPLLQKLKLAVAR